MIQYKSSRQTQLCFCQYVVRISIELRNIILRHLMVRCNLRATMELESNPETKQCKSVRSKYFPTALLLYGRLQSQVKFTPFKLSFFISLIQKWIFALPNCGR